MYDALKYMKIYSLALIIITAHCVLRHNSFIIPGFHPSSCLWESTTYEENIFKNYTDQQIIHLFTPSHPHKNIDIIESDSIVPEFDSRIQWPNCISSVKDSGACAASWAVSTVDTLADRMCIQTGVHKPLSQQDMLSCDGNNFGCNGGFINNAWSYLVSDGVVTEACKPFNSSNGECPNCNTRCNNGEKYTKSKCKSLFSIVSNKDNMQMEITSHGPMQASMDVYKDFLYYKSGVYVSNYQTYLGSQAVRVLGWGVMNGTKYWLAANNWGVRWGENGMFKIGQDQCSISLQMNSCLV